MADSACLFNVVFDADNAQLTKWKVKAGSHISQGTVLLLYDDGVSGPKKWKAPRDGTITELVAREGDSLHNGCVLMSLIGCLHPIIMKDMCADCGADLRESKEEGKESFASVAMVHSVPELRVSTKQAQILGRADEQRLLKSRKLVLLVDLDQTLIHTTNDDVPPNLKDVHHFQLYGANSPWYHARLRPGTDEFLDKVERLFELHICTFGARLYAHTVANILDRDGRFFSHRILSRDECFSANSKTANLKALFPCGDNMVVIIDDREDVWNFAPNVVHVKPYHFFQHTGDINAPPGMTKTECDGGEEERQGADGHRFILGKRIKRTSKLGHKSKTAAIKIEVAAKVETTRTEADADEAVTETKPKVEGELVATALSPTDVKDSGDASLKEEPPAKVDESVVVDTQPIGNYVKALSEKDDVMDVKDVEVGKAQSIDADTKIEITPDNIEHDGNLTDSTSKVNQEQTELDVPKTEADVLALTTTANKSKVEEPLDRRDDSDHDLSSSDDEVSDMDKIEVEDNDDYLLYLSDILVNIHRRFYDSYDKAVDAGGAIPDMKEVIPQVRRRILRGVRLVFSGVIPTNLPMEKSRAFYLARSMGADIQSHLVTDGPRSTTHLVAARLGTVKVNEARRIRGLRIVTPAWLWSCAERWERVDEILFPLTKESSGRDGHLHQMMVRPAGAPTVPTASTVAPPVAVPLADLFPTYDPVTGKRVANGVAAKTPAQAGPSTITQVVAPPAAAPVNFAETINPLMAFSSEDIAKMDREVEDLLEDSDEEGGGGGGNDSAESEDDRRCTSAQRLKRKRSLEREHKADTAELISESSSAESLSGDNPHGWRKSRSEGDVDAGQPLSKYPRGELPEDSDRSAAGDSSTDGESVGSVDEEMAAAVEREFLGM